MTIDMVCFLYNTVTIINFYLFILIIIINKVEANIIQCQNIFTNNIQLMLENIYNRLISKEYVLLENSKLQLIRQINKGE